jgi:hypothetical protein
VAAEHRWEPAYCAFVAARHAGYARAAAAGLGDADSQHSAEDVVSEVFTRLYLAWPRLHPGEADDVARRLLVARVAAARGHRGRRDVGPRVREALEADVAPSAATHDLPSDPDVERLLRAGRKRRRQRRRQSLSVGAGVLAALALVGVLLPGVVTDTHADRNHRTDLPGPARIVDFVLGTSVDQVMQRRVRAHFPDAGEATLVFMGDPGRRASLLPDWLFAEARFWEADYALPSDEQLTVVMSYPLDGGSLLTCPPRQPGGPRCGRDRLGSGTAVTFAERTFSTGVYWFTTRYVTPSGFAVSVRDGVSADSWAQAQRLRSLDRGDTYALVTDPGMVFPPPRQVAG